MTDNDGKVVITADDIVNQTMPVPDLLTEGNRIFETRADLATECSVRVWADDAEAVESTCQMIYGRTTNRMRNYLEARNSNIFTFKFLNPEGNFLSSTRTRLYAAELEPLFGIGTSEPLRLSDGVKTVFYSSEYLKPYQLNLGKAFADMGGSLEIRNGNGKMIRYEIDDNPISPDTRLFRFRNNYGIFERFLATGKCHQQLSIGQSDTITRHQVETGSEIPIRRLPEWTLNKSVATGYLTPDRAQAVMALLLSEEVYIDHDGFWERVSVTTGDKIPAKNTKTNNNNQEG